jgi:hypothetical protein
MMYAFPLVLAAADDTGFAILSLIVGIFALILAVAWLIFPFIVISKCNEMIKLLQGISSRSDAAAMASDKASNDLTENISATRRDLRNVAAEIGQMHETENEISKAMQWMVDNWPSGSERGDLAGD